MDVDEQEAKEFFTEFNEETGEYEVEELEDDYPFDIEKPWPY